MIIDQRPSKSSRRFVSTAIEHCIAQSADRIRDAELAMLLANCLPNTLDTTVTVGRDAQGRPDTFVITGDIDAMWLRDSTAQVWPYLRFAKIDEPLRELIAGTVRRQVKCVLLDPYANAFLSSHDRTSEFADDLTDMLPGVHERKYELDSLCAIHASTFDRLLRCHW